MTRDWKVSKLKTDREMFNNDGTSEFVKKGTRILIMIEDGQAFCPSWKELTYDETVSMNEENECFEFIETVYTKKGNKVYIYEDTETTEIFFRVEKIAS